MVCVICDWCADVLVVVGLHVGTMCHLANTTVTIVLIISIAGECFLFLLNNLRRYGSVLLRTDINIFIC